jgi:hypothetical protein
MKAVRLPVTLFCAELREKFSKGSNLTAVLDSSRPDSFVSYINLPEKRILSVNLKVAICEVRRFPHSTMRYCGQSP